MPLRAYTMIWRQVRNDEQLLYVVVIIKLNRSQADLLKV